ncbi:hypothetical protein D9619_001863 [Psilocybe cf. subviscida]|uniref:Hemerythrin-like domain-containing protein n=1 Tax=Psilocybe cf. subviscida TaxID=2480587 RepID=A0A8H5BEM0_9AGAR|nr:hypothetical protein D9619_001863 [Psilocybe cf. subviscida]
MASSPRYPLIDVATATPNNTNFADNVASHSTEMALIHNVFIRSLNSVHQHARQVTTDAKAFAGYSLILIDMIHMHHLGEETFLFPFLQTKLDMDQNIDQHEAFKGPLTAFEDYMRAVFDGKAKYDGEKVVALVEAFGDTLVEHLHEEIPTISPERLAQFDRTGFDQVVLTMKNWRNKHEPMASIGPFVIFHHDFNAVPNWPRISGIAIFVVKYVLYWRVLKQQHHSYWKFAPFK